MNNIRCKKLCVKRQKLYNMSFILILISNKRDKKFQYVSFRDTWGQPHRCQTRVHRRDSG